MRFVAHPQQLRVLALIAASPRARPRRAQVAYVLGQLCHTASIEPLKQRILDASEHEMVRHEAAGEKGGAWEGSRGGAGVLVSQPGTPRRVGGHSARARVCGGGC